MAFIPKTHKDYLREIKDILDDNPPRRRKSDHLFSCFHCGAEITIDDPYMEIMHYTPHPGKSSYKQFHEKCFEEIAGKMYM